MKRALDGPVGNARARTYTGPVGLAGGIAVKQDPANDRGCLPVTGPGQQCLGITQEADLVNIGVYGVIVDGEGSGISGSALACDIDVIADANGNLVASAAQGDFIIGRTRTSCAEAGDEVIVDVHPYTR